MLIKLLDHLTTVMPDYTKDKKGEVSESINKYTNGEINRSEFTSTLYKNGIQIDNEVPISYCIQMFNFE
jgi:hypothetical protein